MHIRILLDLFQKLQDVGTCHITFLDAHADPQNNKTAHRKENANKFLS